MSARVLVVEPVPADARRMKARLTPGAFHLMGAGTASDALRIVAAWQPDVVLVSAALPDVAGIEILQRIKAAPATTDALVVMVAELEEPARELSELAAGADEFLLRPNELASLARRVRRLARFKRTRDEYRARAETARELALAPAPGPPPTLEDARVAIVDDQASEVALAQAWLARDGVRGVVAPGTPTPGGAATGGFDLVLLDLAASERERRGASCWLREEEKSRRAPLLLITDREGAAGYGGVDDWIGRPLSEARLRARARIQILERRYHARLRAWRDETGADEIDARYAEHHLRRLLGGAATRDLAVLLIEVDRPNGHNQRVRCGRALGDVAATLGANLRVFDTLVHYGEAKFGVLMPGAAPAEALNVGERLRDAIAIASFPGIDEGSLCRLTVSIGIGAGTGACASAEALRARAEEALGRAERAGGNRVELGKDA